MLRYLALTLLAGCSTVPDGPPASECPVVECGWADDGRCPDGYAFSSESTEVEIDDGATTCWVYDAVCTPRPVDPACVPDSCRQIRFTTCAPAERSSR